jgi:hypothetical protein
MTAPVEVLTAAIFFTAVPPIEVNEPPRYATEQSGLNVTVLTLPFTFGSQDETVYGDAALKLNALLRAYVLLNLLIEVKDPTAYIVPPHWASCRTCSVVPVEASCGVPDAGVDDTGPVAADAGTTAQNTLAASAATPAVTRAHH